MNTPTWVEEGRDDLETIANADLPVSWVAQTVLEHYGMDSSEAVEKANRTDTEATIEPNKPSEEEEPKGSIFAY